MALEPRKHFGSPDPSVTGGPEHDRGVESAMARLASEAERLESLVSTLVLRLEEAMVPDLPQKALVQDTASEIRSPLAEMILDRADSIMASGNRLEAVLARLDL
jgi:hypothetical protein